MSEIASNTNTGPSSNLAQPIQKKDVGAGHELMFAALFVGVVDTEVNTDGILSDQTPDGTDVGVGKNIDSGINVLSEMQAIAAMVSGKSLKSKSSKNFVDSKQEDVVLDNRGLRLDNLMDKDGSSLSNVLDEDGLKLGDVLANPLLVGETIVQNPGRKFLPSHDTKTQITAMAYEDDETMPNQPRPTQGALAHPAAKVNFSQQKMSRGAMQGVKLTPTVPDKTLSAGQLSNDVSSADASEIVSKGTAPIASRAAVSQISGRAGKVPVVIDQNNMDIEGDPNTEFENPDELVRPVSGQAERVGLRRGLEKASTDAGPSNLARAALGAGVAAGGQTPQQNNGQSSGQSGGLTNASNSLTNGSMMEMLDMAEDNWTEMLLKRVEKGLAGGKDRIDFHLNPRNLGKMRISLLVQNNQTSVHIQTETVSAAQALGDAESRLVQLMEASGLKFGGLNSQHNQNFGGNLAGQQFGQDRNNAGTKNKNANESEGNEAKNAEISVGQSKNLINMQA